MSVEEAFTLFIGFALGAGLVGAVLAAFMWRVRAERIRLVELENQFRGEA